MYPAWLGVISYKSSQIVNAVFTGVVAFIYGERRGRFENRPWDKGAIMDRRDLLLAILAASDGRPYDPVQIQKAAFLLTRNRPNVVTDGPNFNFTPYDYGPFDADVYNEASALALAGAAAIAPSAAGRWNTYAATDEGLVRGRQILQNLDEGTREYVSKVSAWVRSQSFGGLVKSIYDAYPDMKVNSIFKG